MASSPSSVKHPALSKIHRITGLDLLRSIAILSVVLYHYPKNPDQMFLRAITHYGWAGVDLFFVLSGFLIGGQLFGGMARGEPPSLQNFYLRRLFRTLPAYFAILLIHLFWGELQNRTLLEFGKYLIFIQNFIPPLGFGQSWSLCIEEHFYLIFPLIALAPAFWNKKRARTALLSVIIGSAVLRAAIWYRYRPDIAYSLNIERGLDLHLWKLYYPTYTRLDGLAVGIGLAAIRSFDGALWKRIESHANTCITLGAVLLACAAWILYHRTGFYSSTLGFSVLAAAFGLWVAAGAAPHSWLNRWVMPGAGKLALLSYSIYLTHVLAITAAVSLCAWLGVAERGWQLAIFSATLILLFGAALYYGVERVFLRVRDRIFPSPQHAKASNETVLAEARILT